MTVAINESTRNPDLLFISSVVSWRRNLLINVYMSNNNIMPKPNLK